MTLAAAGFALVPEEHWMLGFAFIFGIGFGGIMSTGWALAIDAVPKLRDVARDLGIWGIAQNFPQVVAPLAGGWLLTLYGHSLLGYRMLFFAAAACFAFGSAIVLAVGKKPFIPWWAVPARILSGIFVGAYVASANRIRSWGTLPAGRGPALIVSNHQVELDLMGPAARFILTGGSKTPVLMACARMMYEPGWMAVRLPWLWRLLYNVNLGWLLEGMGLLPLENELQSRCIARWAFGAQNRHGVLPLDQIFKDEIVREYRLEGLTTRDLFRPENFKMAQETFVRLSDQKMPHKREAFDEMRAGVDRDLAAIENAVRRGATFYVTPEGEYTLDGRMLPFRGIWERLEPQSAADLSCRDQLRSVPGTAILAALPDRRVEAAGQRTRRNGGGAPGDRQCAPRGLARQAERSLYQRRSDEGRNRAPSRVAGAAFVDPELRTNPLRTVDQALMQMTRLGILLASSEHYMLSENRRHPRFENVADIVAFQAAMLAETCQAAQQCSAAPARGASA